MLNTEIFDCRVHSIFLLIAGQICGKCVKLRPM